MTARERAGTIATLMSVATSDGFEVGKIFLEQVESAPAAYNSLVDAASAEDVVAVLMPSLRHLDGIGDPEMIATQLAVSAQVEVLVLPQPSFHQGAVWSSAVRESSSPLRPTSRSIRRGVDRVASVARTEIRRRGAPRDASVANVLSGLSL